MEFKNQCTTFVLLIPTRSLGECLSHFQRIFPKPFSEPCAFSLAGENAEVSMDVSLAYRDDTLAEWTEMAHERVPRKLKCTFPSPKVGRLDVAAENLS